MGLMSEVRRVRGELTVKLLEFMRGRFSYEEGATLGEIVKALYGVDNDRTRARARVLISRVSRDLMAFGVTIVSAYKDQAAGHRYFIVGKPEDLENAIKYFTEYYLRNKEAAERRKAKEADESPT